jgi:hypothetical protein
MDLQKPFNVHDRLIKSQDSRLQQKVKLLKDSGLLLKHSLVLCKLKPLCVTHKIIMMINIMSVTMGSKDQVLHGYVFHHKKNCKLIWISKVDLDFSCLCLCIVVFQYCN